MNAGDYEVEIAYDCPTEDAGSKVRLSAGEKSLEATVAAAPIKDIALPHRDEAGKTRYRNRVWSTLKLGTLDLDKGPKTLTIGAVTKPGAQVMDFKHLRLKRL